MKKDNKKQNKLIHNLRSELFVVMLQIDILKFMREDDLKKGRGKILSTIKRVTENMKSHLEELFP